MLDGSVVVVSRKEINMKRPRKLTQWKKVMRGELFSVFQSRSQARRYRINWKDHNGKWCRYKVWADSVAEAVGKAPDLMNARGPVRPADPRGLLVIEAFEQALAHTHRKAGSRRDW